MSNPRVYSFFEPIEGWSNDFALAELWKLNWQEKGFEPILLSKSDAAEHPFYEEFCEKISQTFELVMGRTILSRDHPWDYYVFHNYIRFLAYANVLREKEPSLVMDYDVYNINYLNHRLDSDSLTFLFGKCPCAVSGSKEQFLSYCKWMANTPANYIETIKSELNKGPFTTLHEMALLHHLHSIDVNTTKNFIFTQVAKSIIGETELNNQHQLVHVSNGYLVNYLQQTEVDIKTLSFSEKVKMRIDLAKNVIDN
jgi:hypothetical protein